MPAIRICAECRHVRQKPSLDPFLHQRVWTAEMVKLRSEWQKERTEIALQEEHRLRAGDDFDYEPETIPWCSAWTDREGAIVDPVTGRRTTLYALCARRNPRGDCTLFERS